MMASVPSPQAGLASNFAVWSMLLIPLVISFNIPFVASEPQSELSNSTAFQQIVQTQFRNPIFSAIIKFYKSGIGSPNSGKSELIKKLEQHYSTKFLFGEEDKVVVDLKVGVYKQHNDSDDTTKLIKRNEHHIDERVQDDMLTSFSPTEFQAKHLLDSSPNVTQQSQEKDGVIKSEDNTKFSYGLSVVEALNETTVIFKIEKNDTVYNNPEILKMKKRMEEERFLVEHLMTIYIGTFLFAYGVMAMLVWVVCVISIVLSAS